MARRGRGQRQRVTLRGWDLIIESTVIIASTIVASLILAFVFTIHGG